MLIDRPQIVEGSFITNPVLPVGTSDPSSPNVGELFFRTDLNIIRVYSNSLAWASLADGQALLDHVNDYTKHLTTAQNDLIDAITVSAAQINSIPTITTNLATLTSSFNTHIADTTLHLSAAQNTLLDGLDLPNLTSTHVNQLIGVTGNVQGQLNTVTSTANANLATLTAHIADDSRHLTASQNTLIDGITVTSTEVNQLAGVTGNIQAQLNSGSSGKVSKAGDTMTGTLAMGANKVTSSAVPTAAIDLSNKKYTDDSDYLNNNPKAGLTSNDATVPIYSDFKFALGVWGSSSFSFIDRDSKQVLYYHAQTPTRKIRAYRAYRFSDNDSWIFDNDPLSATFLTNDENIRFLGNVGTNFIFFAVYFTSTSGFSRYVIAKTNGSSKWQDWTFGYDVSSLMDTNRNFALVQDATNGDRILRLNYASGVETLDVYDASLNLLRSQVLFNNSTDVDYVDHGTGATRTGASIGFSYNPFGMYVAPFTWDPFTQTLHQRNSGYYTTTQSGVNYGTGYGVSIAWTVPRSWLLSGTGTLTNLISTKSGAYRYNAYVDSTWDTDDGGMSQGYGQSGVAISLVTDEYSGNIFLTQHDTFSSATAGRPYRFGYSNGKIYKTWGNAVGSFVTGYSDVVMPDGSAWSKQLDPSFMQVIGNNVQFQGYSSRYGWKLVNTTFSTTAFSSVARPNDTLKLDAAAAILAPQTAWPTAMQAPNQGELGTVVVSGSPIAFWARPGNVIYTASVSGATRTWTPTAVNIPALPSTIGATSGVSYLLTTAWNGSIGSPIVWVLVRTASTVQVAKWAAGTWTISPALFQSELNQGNANRGDTAYSVITNGSNSVLTEQGRWIFDLNVPNTGGTVHYTLTYNVNTDALVVDGWTRFNSPTAGTNVNEYTGEGGYGGAGYGFSSTLGYYAARATSNYDSVSIISSKDVRNVGATITEDQWYNNTATRYEVFMTTESATGLVAYLSEYPIFLGGYYVKVPTMSITLQPSTTNYVYASKDPSDRTTVNVTTSTLPLPNSFTRIQIAAITTNATAITGMTTYTHDGIGLPEKTGNAGKVLKTDGTTLYWDTAGAAGTFVSKTGDLMSGALQINKSVTAVTPYPDSVLHATQTDGGRVRIMVETTAELPGITFRRSNGTQAAKTPVNIGDTLAFMNHHSWDGAQFIAGSSINFTATETHSTAGRGSNFVVTVTGNQNIGQSTMTFDYNGLTVGRGNIASGGGFRATQGLPLSGDNSTVGYAFGTDGDTGMFAIGSGNGAGTIAFAANGTEAGRMLSTGKWAIGALDNTLGRFGVSGSAGNGSTPDLVLDSDATYAYIQSYGSKTLRINAQGNPAWFNGAVGVGTSPAVPLHTKGISEVLRLDTTAARGVGQVFLTFTDTTGRKGWFGYGSTVNDVMYVSNDLSTSMIFRTGAADRVTIESDGTFRYGNLEVGFRDIPPAVGGWIRGGCFVTTAGQTMSASQPGYTFSIYNNSASSITLTQAAGVTIRLGGTTATGNRTLLPYGFATLWYMDGTNGVINGNLT